MKVEPAEEIVDTTNSSDKQTLMDFETVSTSAGTIVSSSPNYITATVTGDNDATTSGSISQPTFVQFVDAVGSTYNVAANGQLLFPVYALGNTDGTMYTPASEQYFTPTSTPEAYTQMTDSIGQLLSSDSGSFLIQSNAAKDDPTDELMSTAAACASSKAESATEAMISDDAGAYLISGKPSCALNKPSPSSSNVKDTSTNMSHGNKVSRATVKWLLENYETAVGVSLSRSILYSYYLRHCSENKFDPMNQASFGKIIHSIYPGLRTRRLGTRGNSKYHYYGIRVKANSPLVHLKVDDIPKQKPTPNSQANNLNCNNPAKVSPRAEELPQYHQYLGDASGVIPDFPEIIVQNSLPNGCTIEDIDIFWSTYREHCEAFLDTVMNLEFATIESLWREFWSGRDSNNRDECKEENNISKAKLYRLCECPEVQEFVKGVDYAFYHNIVNKVLMPDVLIRIPNPLSHSIRTFANGLESCLTTAMSGCPKEIVEIKLNAVSALAQTLRRYTSLNDLAQEARAVLQNSNQINQMLADLNGVDFHNVHERAFVVCQCDRAVMQRFEVDFKVTLRQYTSLEKWADWLNEVVMEVLQPFEGQPTFDKAAKQFLLQWSFYSSMIIKDLTLRGVGSFLAFYRIRLFFDEYLLHLIEKKVAERMGTTPIADLGQRKACMKALLQFSATVAN